MSYVWLVVQIMTAVPDLIRAWREIKKLMDEDEKAAAKVALKEITAEFRTNRDPVRFKENLVAVRAELKNLPHV